MLPPARCRQLPERRLDWVEVVLSCPPTMRICLVYDCLYPHTVGGAERWLRSLAERLAAEGHEVTYLTLRQWPRGEHPSVPGVKVVAVGPRHGALHERAGAGGSCRRSCSGSGVLRAPAAPRPQLRRRAHRVVPLLLAPRRGARARWGATGWWSTGTRSGRAPTGTSTSAASAAASAGGSSGSACGSLSARSASRNCTPSACARRASAAR